MERTTRSEKDVLKLVHPGKHIEMFTKPIPASEVLKKYPKFCITRPDVFQFPWIVMKSDSILVPGKVFFLVPKRTIYRLLKANQPPNGSSLSLLSSSLPPLSHSLSGPSSAPLSTRNAGMTPKHQTRLLKRSKPLGEDGGIRRGRKNSHVESLPPRPPSVVRNKKSSRYSSSHVHDCYKCGNVASAEVSRENVGNGGRGKRKMTLVRSCMRKSGSAPRLANLRVRFSIPSEDVVEHVAKQKTVIESLSKLATSLIVDVCK